nr:hypothetical protein [Tanacetum cinerariifolium]
MTNAKEMWEAIKSRFGGNDESKKMQKYLLKQQFEGFSMSTSEGLHKGYDRFQTLLSQLEIHGAGVSHEDANHKFLRSLPSSWSQVALIMRIKPSLDTLSFDDLYNNLRVFERDVKVTIASSSNTQNVAFVSANSTNDINDDGMEEMDLKWQVAMISMRIKKFLKRTGRKLQFDTKDPVGFDKTKVECFNCHKIKHFARDCRAKENQDSRRRDDGYNGNKARDNGRRLAYKDDSKALVTIDGEDIDWVLVTNTQNKTPYELLDGRQPIISYLRPFGCHVTILNTIDQLGKFDGKSDSGFLVGYYLNSKAFRVYNLETKRVEENLHVTFLENKPNVARNGHAWMFDLDYLTNSMIYEPVLVENQANKSASPNEANNSIGTQANDDQSANSEEIDIHEEHFVLPIWSAYSTTIKSSGEKIKKTTDVNTTRKETTHANQDAHTNLLNVVSAPISTTGPSRAFDDDDEGVVTDFNNLETTVTVSPTPTTRIHTIHPKTQIIRDPLSAIQTRSKVNKNFKARALVTPKTSYLQAVKGIFRYIKSQPKLGVWYPKVSSFELKSYLDSDYAGANLNRTFTTGEVKLDLKSSCWDRGSLCVGFHTTSQMVINSPCLTHIKNWLVQEKTALDKDFLNPLMAKSLPKLYGCQLTMSHVPRGQCGTNSVVQWCLFSSALQQTCATLSQKVAHLEQDKIAQALDIIKLKMRVKKLEKQRRSKSLGLKRLRKKASAVEPTVFDDEEVTMTMDRTLIKMKAKKERILDEQITKRLHDEEVKQAVAREKKYNKVQTLFKPDRDEEPTQKREVEETLLHESFKKLKEVEVSSSPSTQDTPTNDPKEMSEEDVKNMLEIILVFEFKVEAIQVKVGGITQAYQSFEDMLKDFDREDLDTLWRLVKEKFSTSVHIVDKEKALWVELTRLFEPNATDVFWKLQIYMHDLLTWKLYTNCGVHQVSSTRRHDIFMLTEKDYPLSDAVMILMLRVKLQVDEDCEMARDLVMKIFKKANKPKSKSLDTSSK